MENREHKKSVVNSATKIKKEPLSKTLMGMFIKSDFDSVKNWVINEKIAPGITNLFLDTLSMILTGDSRGRATERTEYNKVYVGSSGRNENRRDMARSRSDYRDIVFESKDDAMKVVDMLKDTIDEYERGASILDLFEFAGRSTLTRDTDDSYGWKDLPEPTKDYVIGTSAGYELKLPPVVVLSR